MMDGVRVIKDVRVRSSSLRLAQAIDEAFQWLEQAVEARDFLLFSIPTFSWWDPLRSDPRFKALLKKMGLA